MCIEYARADPISLEDADVADGYVALRKVTITPTRRIYEAPELIMGNRVLRADEEKYAADKFLRIQFRDDDWTRIVPNIGKQFIRYFVSYPLIKGIEIGGLFIRLHRIFLPRLFNCFQIANSIISAPQIRKCANKAAILLRQMTQKSSNSASFWANSPSKVCRNIWRDSANALRSCWCVLQCKSLHLFSKFGFLGNGQAADARKVHNKLRL